jgi:ABC-type multidrug transport system permease subunit
MHRLYPTQLQESAGRGRNCGLMAVSGVRDTDQERLSVWDGLMFWGVQYRRLSLTALLRGVWFFALWAGLSAGLLAPVLAQVKGGAGLYLLLGWVAALHLLGRGWLERRLPDPSFAQDVRTGNFEQLRLAPLTAHGLLVQRGVPDMLFRAATQSVWLPVYAIVVGALGASLADACALWLLFSFANYFVLGLVSLILLIPSEEIHWILLCGLLAYALLLDGGRVRTAVSSSSLFSVMLALPIVGRVLLPIQAMATLPNLLPFTLVWLLVEWLRFERLARWVNAPSGLGRWAYLLPSAALMITTGVLFGQWSRQTLSLVGAELSQIGVCALFAAVGYLSLLLLTVRRQAEPIVQPLRAHLLETGLLRLLSMLLIGVAVAIWGLADGVGGVLGGAGVADGSGVAGRRVDAAGSCSGRTAARARGRTSRCCWASRLQWCSRSRRSTTLSARLAPPTRSCWRRRRGRLHASRHSRRCGRALRCLWRATRWCWAF